MHPISFRTRCPAPSLSQHLYFCLFLGLMISHGPTNSLAQPCAPIAGTYQMTQVVSYTRAMGGQITNTTQTYSIPGVVEVTQNNNVFTISENVLTGIPLTGTMTNNYVTSLSGPVITYAIDPNLSVSTNSIISVSSSLTSTQFVIAYQGQAKGREYSYNFTDNITCYIYLTGKFTPLLHPRIVVQPASLTNVIGSQAAFSVEATNATPFYYQWRKNGVLIPYATSSTYVINSVATADAGDYSVQVSNSIGSTNSSKATLTLRCPPTITVQPIATLKQQFGTTATLKVKATGTPNLFYQWRVNGKDLTNATNSACALSFDPVDGNTNFTVSVYVTNAFGSTLSSNANLFVLPDVTLPVVTITSPAANARTATPAFSGIATDNSRLARVNYWVTNINNGIITNNDQGTALLVGTNLSKLGWQANPSLLPGTNIFVVQSVDVSGNVSVKAKCSFFYKVPAPFLLTSGGEATGTVVGISSFSARGEPVPRLGTTNLYIGQGYSIQAVPAPVTSFFTNWTGDTIGSVTNSLIKFTMETGLTLQVNFATNRFVGMAGIYNGLFSNTNGELSAASAGMLRHLLVNKDGTYSGQLVVAGIAYALGGSFDKWSGHSQKTIARALKAGGPILVDMDLMWNKTPRQALGIISTPAWTAELTANLSGTQSQTGTATALISPADDSLQSAPDGSGYLLVTTKAGTATFTGALADGTAVSQSAPLSEQMSAPVYASLYKNTGLLWGWLEMTNNTPAGVLFWAKPASNGPLFRNGFTNNLNVLGSPWSIPKGSALPFSVTNPGRLEISGGNIAAPINYSNIVVSSANIILNATTQPTNTLSGSIAPKSGLLKITFGNGKAKISGVGAVLQNSTNAGGAFLGTTNTGSIRLH